VDAKFFWLNADEDAYKLERADYAILSDCVAIVLNPWNSLFWFCCESNDC